MRACIISAGFWGLTTLAWAAEAPYPYNRPVLATVAAGLESREYPHVKGEWSKLELPWPADSGKESYYRRPVTVHARGSATGDSSPLFIFFGCSYSTFKSGTWNRKVSALLDKIYGTHEEISFPGFLSTEGLKAQGKYIPISYDPVAADLYLRLRAHFLRRQRLGYGKARIGVIGVSGGASLVISILAADAEYARRHRRPKLFSLGGLAFSPVLDVQRAFAVLDRAVDRTVRAGYRPSQTLSNPGFIVQSLFQGFSSATILRPDFVRDTQATDEIEARFYNEFIYEDLKNTAGAYHSRAFRFGPKSAGYDGDRYADYYQDYGMRQLYALGLDRKISFDELTDPSPNFPKIAAPLKIVFPWDDPVLSAGGSARIRERLARARQNPRIEVFTPAYGGHMGYFLNTAWLERSLRNFFK